MPTLDKSCGGLDEMLPVVLDISILVSLIGSAVGGGLEGLVGEVCHWKPTRVYRPVPFPVCSFCSAFAVQDAGARLLLHPLSLQLAALPLPR